MTRIRALIFPFKVKRDRMVSVPTVRSRGERAPCARFGGARGTTSRARRMLDNLKKTLSATAIALGIAAVCLGARFAQAAEGCAGKPYGGGAMELFEESGLVWVDKVNVTFTLCSDGTAVGGGRFSIKVAPPENHVDEDLGLDEDVIMTFYWAPYAWVNHHGPFPEVFADLIPIGQFRQLLLDLLDGDESALEGWLAKVQPPLPEGGYDFNGDGLVDIRLVYWFVE